MKLAALDADEADDLLAPRPHQPRHLPPAGICGEGVGQIMMETKPLLLRQASPRLTSGAGGAVPVS